MMPESEEEIDDSEKIEFSSPSRLKRLLAFGMDFVLLTLCSTLLLFYIPKFHGEEAIIEFERLSEQLSGSFSSNQSEASDVENLMIQFSDFTEKNEFMSYGQHCFSFHTSLLVRSHSMVNPSGSLHFIYKPDPYLLKFRLVGHNYCCVPC